MTDETKHHLIFPSYVMESHFDKHTTLKAAFKKVALRHFNEEGYSNELTGHIAIHHEPALAPMYVFAVQEAKRFIAGFKINPEFFDFNVVKSWMNVSRKHQTNMHGHKDAHISFAYYMNVPEESNSPIMFQNYDDRHEPYAGMSRWNDPTQWDVINSYTWTFDVREGQLMVFSSNMIHGVMKDQPEFDQGVKNIAALNASRICIAGDILLTYKEPQSKPLGLQPVKNWRKFD